MGRKPKSESWESFGERRIREAQENGAFDSLSGFGKPIPDLEGPDDPDWWLKKKLRQENLAILPPILEARLDIERTLASLGNLRSEAEVRRCLEALNVRVRRAHFSPASGPVDGVCPVDVEAAVSKWRSGHSC